MRTTTPFQGIAPVIDQEVAAEGTAIVHARIVRGLACEREGVARHLALAAPGRARVPLDDVAITIACRKILMSMDAGGARAQDLLHRAQVLDEVLPVHRADEAQTADAVGDGDLVGRRGTARPLQQ